MVMDKLLRKVNQYLPADDIDFIKKAFHFADQAHRGQYRKSGETYIHHPVEVASILADLQLDAVTIAAALLHDVLEDTAVTEEELEREFGPEVAQLVSGVTKLKRIKYKSREEQQAENHRRMFVAMAKDIRVILIKLADRLHNMRTLKYVSPEKQRQKAEETFRNFWKPNGGWFFWAISVIYGKAGGSLVKQFTPGWFLFTAGSPGTSRRLPGWLQGRRMPAQARTGDGLASSAMAFRKVFAARSRLAVGKRRETLAVDPG